MIDNLPSVTTTMVRVALDGLAAQQRVLANNIANANSTDFHAQRLDFETALRAAAEQGRGESAADMKERLWRVAGAIKAGEFVSATEGDGVQLDTEMAQLNQTVLKYQALIQGLNSFGALNSLALERGR